jgi:hypothetical protein
MSNISVALLAAACLALAGNAHAGCEFPYYPEYVRIPAPETEE